MPQISLKNLDPINRYLIAGQMTRDYLILPNGKIRNDIPGGSGLFACAGLLLWDKQVSLLSRVSSDYPPEWLNTLAAYGVDTIGIQRSETPFHQEQFLAVHDWQGNCGQNPTAEYAKHNRPIPKSLTALLTDQYNDLKTPSHNYLETIRVKDIPQYHKDASCLLVMSMSAPEQQAIINLFHNHQIPQTILSPARTLMQMDQSGPLKQLCTGIKTICCTEQDLRCLSRGKNFDCWEWMEMIASFNCDTIIMLNGLSGFSCYSAYSNKRYVIPVYPFARKSDPMGCEPAFCGGYAAGHRLTYDPLEALLYGAISASVVLESSGGFAPLDCLADLLPHRLRTMRQLVKLI